MMTREEAYEIIEEVRNKICSRKYVTEQSEAFDMVLELLKQEPCEDAISREYILSKAYAYGNGPEPEGYCVDVEDIQYAPSVQLKQKQ